MNTYSPGPVPMPIPSCTLDSTMTLNMIDEIKGKGVPMYY